MTERWRETYTDHNYYDGDQDWRESRLLAHEILLQQGRLSTNEDGEVSVDAQWRFKKDDGNEFHIELSELKADSGYATYNLSVTNVDEIDQEIVFTFTSKEETPEDIQIGPDFKGLGIHQYATENQMILEFLMTGTTEPEKFDVNKFVERTESEKQFWKIVGAYSLDIFADQQAIRRLASKPRQERWLYQKNAILKDVLGYRGIDPLVIRSALDDQLDELYDQIHPPQDTLRPTFSDTPTDREQ